MLKLTRPVAFFILDWKQPVLTFLQTELLKLPLLKFYLIWKGR